MTKPERQDSVGKAIVDNLSSEWRQGEWFVLCSKDQLIDMVNIAITKRTVECAEAMCGEWNTKGGLVSQSDLYDAILKVDQPRPFWCEHIELYWNGPKKSFEWRSSLLGFDHIPSAFFLCPVCGRQRPF